jgi:hypothetical protein
MASEHQLLHYTLEYHIPKDSVGVRPTGERRSGPLWLLCLTLMTLRYHFWQVVQFLLLGLLFCLVPLAVAAVAGGWLAQAGLRWASFLPSVATWPVAVPVAAGLSHAILLVLQRYCPPWYEVVRPMLSLRLYGNVLMAGLPAIAAMWATSLGLMLAGASPALGGVGQGIWANWVSRLPSAVLPNLVALPFVFAGLDAVATWSPFGRALRRNLRFATHNPWLLLGFGLVQAAIGSGSALTQAVIARHKDWLPEGWLWGGVPILGGLAAMLAIAALHTVIHPMFYREFVWREREAGQASAARAIAS